MNPLRGLQHLQSYFSEYNKNTGRIKQIDGEKILVSIAKSWGVGDMMLTDDQCLCFTPQIDDRVFLCKDDNGKTFLVKMTKNRGN